MPPEDFCALILTHGRPDNVKTIRSLELSGYTGPWFLVLDDEDDTYPEYVALYGAERIRRFSRAESATKFDQGDNFPPKGVVYARAATWEIARDLGYRYFIQLDDDYERFRYRFTGNLEYPSTNVRIGNLDAVWTLMLAWFQACPQITTLAMAQGGDFVGGGASGFAGFIGTKRKAMNSFLCDVEREFHFLGRLNEDVNAYTQLQRTGPVFLTTNQVGLEQTPTQADAGGMTEMYLDSGTYVKSFYSVMRCPSAVRVSWLHERIGRIHHRVDYNACAPKILAERHQKARAA